MDHCNLQIRVRATLSTSNAIRRYFQNIHLKGPLKALSYDVFTNRVLSASRPGKARGNNLSLRESDTYIRLNKMNVF